MVRCVTKIIISICASLSVFVPCVLCAEQWKLTVDAATERAISENRDVAIARERLAEFEGLKGEAISSAIPHVTANASYTRMWRKQEIAIQGQTFSLGTANTYNAGATLTQVLWDGKVLKAVQAAREELISGMEHTRDVETQIKFIVRQTFYEILYSEKVVSVLEEQLKQLRAHLSSIRARYNKGLDSDYALMRQEVEVSNIEPQLIDSKRRVELLNNMMKVLLAIPPEDIFVANGSLRYMSTGVPDSWDLIDRAKMNRADLAAGKHHEKALEQGVGMEKAGYLPTLNFSSTFLWQGMSEGWHLSANERTDSLQSMFSFSWPIFDGLKTHARVRQARAKLLQQKYSNSQLEDNIVKDVRDSIETLVRSKEALKSQEKSYTLARKATKIAGERFAAGLMSQLELNDTIHAQSKAEQLYLQAVYDCIVSEAALARAVGGEL